MIRLIIKIFKEDLKSQQRRPMILSYILAEIHNTDYVFLILGNTAKVVSDDSDGCHQLAALPPTTEAFT